MVAELFQNEFIVNSAIAGIIVIAGFIAGHFFSKAVGLAIGKFGLSEKIKQRGLPKPEVMIEKAIRYIIYALAIIAALNRLGIIETVISIASIIALSIVIIILFLQSKDFISNTAAKIIYPERHLAPGKKIKIDGISGEILKAGLTEVKVRTDKGNIIIFPNSYLLKRPFKVSKKAVLKK